jgi:tRNA-Thr(GGU) m(6)t(6)A37 methyltransferase TsaA
MHRSTNELKIMITNILVRYTNELLYLNRSTKNKKYTITNTEQLKPTTAQHQTIDLEERLRRQNRRCNLQKDRCRKMTVKIELCPIGVVEIAGEHEAKIRIFPEFCAGLKGMEDFSHFIVLYWIHLRDNTEDRRTLLVFPRRHAVNVQKGVFSCRSPSRPNPIGLCIVKLTKVENNVLTVEGLDALEASPVIDIKPYVPKADAVPDAHVPEWTWNGPTT